MICVPYLNLCLAYISLSRKVTRQSRSGPARYIAHVTDNLWEETRGMVKGGVWSEEGWRERGGGLCVCASTYCHVLRGLFSPSRHWMPQHWGCRKSGLATLCVANKRGQREVNANPVDDQSSVKVALVVGSLSLTHSLSVWGLCCKLCAPRS